jgi:hypothetical protein
MLRIDANDLQFSALFNFLRQIDAVPPSLHQRFSAVQKGRNIELKNLQIDMRARFAGL